MPYDLEKLNDYTGDAYEANGVSESIPAKEEGNGPPCPGCNKPTIIKNGRFFCSNKGRASDNSFQCPLQTADSEIEVTQYIPEDAKQKALEAEKDGFPDDELAPKEERDFSFPDEHPEQQFSATPPEESPFDIEIDAKDLEMPAVNLDPATQQILEMAEKYGAKTMEEVLALPDEIRGPIFERVSYSQRNQDAEQQEAA